MKTTYTPISAKAYRLDEQLIDLVALRAEFALMGDSMIVHAAGQCLTVLEAAHDLAWMNNSNVLPLPLRTLRQRWREFVRIRGILAAKRIAKYSQQRSSSFA